jgi:hypothetical protein
MAPFMESILAISVQHQIEKYGAYAGFGAIIGLAILSLLYFAQAREVKRLREWAGRSPERTAELQERVQAEAQRRVVAAPTPAPPAATGVAAAATPAGAATAAAAPAAAVTAAGQAIATPPADQPTTAQPAATPIPAATPAPVANGQAPKPGQPLRVPSGTRIPPTPATPAGATARAQAAAAGDDGDRGRLRTLAPIFGAVAAIVVVAVVAVVLLTGGSDDKTPSATKASTTVGAAAPASGDDTTTPRRTTPATAAKPSTYTVSVLNGTAVPGLARGVAVRLQNDGWTKIGTVTNAADQTRSQTLVEYAPNHRREALAVAKAIDVGTDAVQALSSGSRTIAGDAAAVVVTVGADQNTPPPGQTQ